jgi:catechol 2,3-dioxygenase-like lactoylglutathione lyase family enzyme
MPATQEAVMLKELPLRMHHHAYAVKDQEANRHFIEDVLGIPLVATWCERTFRPEVGREVDYCHTFFEIADGGALAFFQFADAEAYEKNRAILQEVGGSWHMALKVTQGSFDELQQRCETAGVPVRTTDHGFCTSMYLKTPDGLRLEFTVDAPDAERIAAMRRADAHSELARWLAGDRHVNNDDRPH